MPISDRKLTIIKRRFGKQSVAEMARELNLREKDIRDALIELGLEKPAGAPDGSATSLHSRRWMIIAAAAAVILTTVCFGFSMRYPMVFDDHHAIGDNQYIRDSGNYGAFFVDPVMFSNEPERRMYRPLVLLTYALNYAIGENNPPSYRIFDLLLHAINGFLIFLILDLLLRSRPLALLTAAVFLVHPAVVESVVYLSARSTLMAGAFLFGTIYAFLRQWKTGRNSRWTAAAGAMFLFGILSKENVFMAPAILLTGEYLINGVEPREFISQKRWKMHAPIWILAFAYLLFRKFGLALPTAVLSRPERSFGSQLLTQSGVWLDYLGKFLWPIGLNNQPMVIPSHHLWDGKLAVTDQPLLWIIIWCAIAALVYFGRRNRTMLWGISFSALVLLPETLTTLNQLANERRLYLPLFGVLLAAASICETVSNEAYRRRMFAMGMLIVVLLIPVSILRVTSWKSEKSLWFDSIRKAPGSETSWHGLGYVYGQDPNYEKSLWALKHALVIDPNYSPSMRLIGGVLLTLNKPAEALPYLERSVRIESLAHRGWYNLGIAQEKLGRFDDAIQSYKKAISLNKFYAQPHNNIATIYARQGKNDQAEREFEEAIRLDPGNQDYKRNLEMLKSP